MNIKNLEVNKGYKYKELCAVLGEDEKGRGNSRNLQFRNWQRYFEWERQGHKYIVQEIYDNPKPKVDGRKNNGRSKVSQSNNKIYQKYIESLILDLLVQQYQNKNTTRKIYMSRDRLLKALSMVNDNYTYCKFNKEQLAAYAEIRTDNAREFFDLTNTNLLSAVERALKSLDNKFLVKWDLVTTVVINEGVEVIDDEGNPIRLKENHRTATDAERSIILQTESEIAEEMGYDTKQIIYLTGQYEKFVESVCNRINNELELEEEEKLLTYYKSYDIIFHENITKEKEKIDKFLMEYEERENVKITLNGIISKKLLTNAKRRHEKSKEEVSSSFIFGQPKSDDYESIRNLRRASVDYVQDNETIIDTVINKKTRDITHDIKQVWIKQKKRERKEEQELDKLFGI